MPGECCRWWLMALCLASSAVAAEADLSGHLKARVLGDSYPDNSVFRAPAGSTGTTAESDLRLKMAASYGSWSIDADYQAFVIAGDNQRIASDFLLAGDPSTLGVLDDSRRWFDLTHSIRETNSSRLIHRLDRLSVSWTSERTVVRFGRQALSWGGGLFYAPMDIVNPFDPATVDTEYKTGDDMLYAQYLRSNGDDLQLAYVGRRDLISGDFSARESTTALKYHGIVGNSEFDVLLADNRDRNTVGLGAGVSLGGAILRADVITADTGSGWVTEWLANLSYSWTAWGRNMTGAVEYYHNGWGLRSDGYSVADIAADAELAQRLARAETFTIGRNYLAAGVTIELTPLWILTPNVFANIDDPSALLQVVLQHSLGDNLTLLAAANLPMGPDGSEFGGIASVFPPDQYFSRTAGVFAQLAWYF